VLDKMLKMGCTPDLISNDTVMGGLCNIGEIEKAGETAKAEELRAT
jgi:hypothetical protein